ncbi:MAG: hypothetical protein HZB14_07620 [Actinobacteria bacterium]|nr:hypothetical protein [Actinomycetota bacterium]
MKAQRLESERQATGRKRNWWMASVVAACTAMLVAAVVALSLDDGESADEAAVAISHIHGLGVEASDRSLLIATHDGLLRSADGSTSIERVGEAADDLMGFSVVGERNYISSGHPASAGSGPANLGLRRSTDGGMSWEQVSLDGEADFHVLRGQGDSVIGMQGHDQGLFASANNGESWSQRSLPKPAADLAIDPGDPNRIVASTTNGIYVSNDLGASWKRAAGSPLGLLAWDNGGRLFLIDGTGEIWSTKDPSSKLVRAGTLGETPVAVAAASGSIYAALEDGTVKVSTDGGATWQLRAAGG